METDIAEDMRLRGAISNIDGVALIKVPVVRLSENFWIGLVNISYSRETAQAAILHLNGSQYRTNENRIL